MSTMTAPIISPSTRTANLIDDYALARVDYRVRRLTTAFRLDDDTAEDLRQNMMVQLLRAARRYNPTRTRPHTFVTRVLDRYYLHAARALSNCQKHGSKRPTPMSALEDFNPTVNDPRQGERAECERSDLAFDLVAVVATLPEALQRICDELRFRKPSEVAERLGVHRSTIYRAIGQIRRHFTAAGLGTHCERRRQGPAARRCRGANGTAKHGSGNEPGTTN